MEGLVVPIVTGVLVMNWVKPLMESKEQKCTLGKDQKDL